MEPAREISRPEILTPEEYKSMGGKPLASTAEPVETQAAQLDVSTITNEDDNEPSELRNRVDDDGEGVPSGDRPEDVPANAEGRSTGGTRNQNGQSSGRTRTAAAGSEPGSPGQ